MASTLSLGLDFIAKEQIKQILNDLNSDKDLYKQVNYPLIYTNSDVVNYKNSSPFALVTPLSNYATKVVYGSYQDLDKDESIQKVVSKHYLYKILDKWLYKDLRSLLAFVKIADGKPQLIRSMSEYNPESTESDSVENIEKKVEYMEHILIDKKLVKHVLKKIVAENDVHWYHLNKHEDMIKKIFKKYISSKLEEAIKGYSK